MKKSAKPEKNCFAIFLGQENPAGFSLDSALPENRGKTGVFPGAEKLYEFFLRSAENMKKSSGFFHSASHALH